MPFLSEYDKSANNKPFLGSGYYFWDFNQDYASYWGVSHYKNSFYIIEADVFIDLDDEGYFLDLVGNRKHLVGFVNLLREFNLIHEEGTKGIDLCYIINYLRNSCPPEVFPFKVIRAVDYSNDDIAGIKIKFNDKSSNRSFTILNPRIIISYREKTDIVFNSEPFVTFVSEN
jgi:hypothetical protein